MPCALASPMKRPITTRAPVLPTPGPDRPEFWPPQLTAWTGAKVTRDSAPVFMLLSHSGVTLGGKSIPGAPSSFLSPSIPLPNPHLSFASCFGWFPGIGCSRTQSQNILTAVGDQILTAPSMSAYGTERDSYEVKGLSVCTVYEPLGPLTSGRMLMVRAVGTARDLRTGINKLFL